MTYLCLLVNNKKEFNNVRYIRTLLISNERDSILSNAEQNSVHDEVQDIFHINHQQDAHESHLKMDAHESHLKILHIRTILHIIPE